MGHKKLALPIFQYLPLNKRFNKRYQENYHNCSPKQYLYILSLHSRTRINNESHSQGVSHVFPNIISSNIYKNSISMRFISICIRTKLKRLVFGLVWFVDSIVLSKPLTPLLEDPRASLVGLHTLGLYSYPLQTSVTF
jgi:hypothetical protein